MAIIKWVWSKWLTVARPVGNFQAQIILGIFYLMIIVPVGLMLRFLADPLEVKREKILRQRTSFRTWEHPKGALKSARRQY